MTISYSLSVSAMLNITVRHHLRRKWITIVSGLFLFVFAPTKKIIKCTYLTILVYHENDFIGHLVPLKIVCKIKLILVMPVYIEVLCPYRRQFR